MSLPGVPVDEKTSQPFIARWNRLISTTNWEKGRIIYEWREALVDATAPASEYSDEAWRRRVEGVSGQHVGRLRRVYERFGGVHQDYEGLFWSHFQAALDWADAEMWLEGAVQNKWSISEMRRQRWEAHGAPEDKKPREEDIVSVELDEDAMPPRDGTLAERFAPTLERVTTGPDYGEGPDFGAESEYEPGPGDEAAFHNGSGENGSADAEAAPNGKSVAELAVRPFESLPELPPDVDEAYEQFKLVILRHKLTDWAEVSAEDLLSVLNALKVLVSTPAE